MMSLEKQSLKLSIAAGFGDLDAKPHSRESLA